MFRSGVGRLVAACEAPPVVLPIVHSGMERVMPRGATFPVPGQEVCSFLTDAREVVNVTHGGAIEHVRPLFECLTTKRAESKLTCADPLQHCTL